VCEDGRSGCTHSSQKVTRLVENLNQLPVLRCHFSLRMESLGISRCVKRRKSVPQSKVTVDDLVPLLIDL